MDGPIVTIKLDKFNLAKKAVRVGVDRAVRGLAFKVQELYVRNVQHYSSTEDKLVDTGMMWNSAYVETSRSSERDEKISAAKSLEGTTGKHTDAPHEFKEAVPSGKPSELESKMGVAAEYAVYHELGWGVPERACLHPAVTEVEGLAKDYSANQVRKAIEEGL